MAREAHQAATAEPGARVWPVEVDEDGASVLDERVVASLDAGDVLALPGMLATCERCWAEPAVAFVWWLPPMFVGERCLAEDAGRSRQRPIVIRRSG